MMFPPLCFLLFCLAEVVLTVEGKSWQQSVVDYHNTVRSNIARGRGPTSRQEPRASNMRKMSWNSAIARNAQNWANHLARRGCGLAHSSSSARRKIGGYNVGENLAGAEVMHGMRLWFEEYKVFSFGASNNNFMRTGHYTQMVWADSHQIGCGVARCGRGVVLNCQYGPGGNFNPFYKPYRIGKACSACPSKARSCQNGLCAQSFLQIAQAVSHW